jgi:cobalt-zinc-cadmium efflux system membrane fusion protein
MMKRIKYILFIILITSCQGEKKESNIENSPVSITLSHKQIRKADIKTDNINRRLFSPTFRCNGYFSIHPNKLATVTAPINGFVKKMFYNTGDYIKKGALLAVLKHQDYIKIQKDYIEAKNQVDYYIEDFKRQGELSLEHAASIKKMQRAQTDYWANEARLRALKAQMEFIGIDTEKVEKEGFTTNINIYAPISGYITKVEGNIGKFVDSYTFIYEIADIDELLLSFEIPVDLYYNVYKNMPVLFSLPDTANALSGAIIKGIGQVFNTETNTVGIIAQPDSVNKALRPGMNVEVIIDLKDKLLPSLPDEAIMKLNNNSFIFIKDNNNFIRVPVQTGSSINGYTEIKDVSEEIENADIVVSGVQYLNKMLNNL